LVILVHKVPRVHRDQQVQTVSQDLQVRKVKLARRVLPALKVPRDLMESRGQLVLKDKLVLRVPLVLLVLLVPMESRGQLVQRVPRDPLDHRV